MAARTCGMGPHKTVGREGFHLEYEKVDAGLVDSFEGDEGEKKVLLRDDALMKVVVEKD